MCAVWINSLAEHHMGQSQTDGLGLVWADLAEPRSRKACPVALSTANMGRCAASNMRALALLGLTCSNMSGRLGLKKLDQRPNMNIEPSVRDTLIGGSRYPKTPLINLLIINNLTK